MHSDSCGRLWSPRPSKVRLTLVCAIVLPEVMWALNYTRQTPLVRVIAPRFVLLMALYCPSLTSLSSLRAETRGERAFSHRLPLPQRHVTLSPPEPARLPLEAIRLEEPVCVAGAVVQQVKLPHGIPSFPLRMPDSSLGCPTLLTEPPAEVPGRQLLGFLPDMGDMGGIPGFDLA